MKTIHNYSLYSKPNSHLMKRRTPFLQTSILLLGIILSGLLQSCGHGKCHCDDDYGGYSDVSDKMKSFFPYKEGSYYVGRTEFDSPDVDNEVLINAEEGYLRTGEFFTVKITAAEDFDLYAEVVKN